MIHMKVRVYIPRGRRKEDACCDHFFLSRKAAKGKASCTTIIMIRVELESKSAGGEKEMSSPKNKTITYQYSVVFFFSI